MHVPINLVLLLALPASHALVIPEPNLQSADLALTAGKVINAVPVVNTVHVEYDNLPVKSSGYFGF